MAYITIAATQTDADSPLDETLFEAIRGNFDFLKGELDGTLALHDSNIWDNFTYANGVLDAAIWDSGISAGGLLTHIHTSTEHVVLLRHTSSSAGTAHIAAANAKARVHLGIGADCRFIMEMNARVNSVGPAGRVMALGLQDSTLAVGSAPIVTDVSDFIGFVHGTSDNTVRLRASKAGAASLGSDDQGVLSSWTTLRVDITRASGVFTLRGFIDGAEVGGSPLSTNIPDTVLLRPVIGVGDTSGAAGQLSVSFDYCNAYWVGRPLTP